MDRYGGLFEKIYPNFVRHSSHWSLGYSAPAHASRWNQEQVGGSDPAAETETLKSNHEQHSTHWPSLQTTVTISSSTRTILLFILQIS